MLTEGTGSPLRESRRRSFHYGQTLVCQARKKKKIYFFFCPRRAGLWGIDRPNRVYLFFWFCPAGGFCTAPTPVGAGSVPQVSAFTRQPLWVVGDLVLVLRAAALVGLPSFDFSFCLGVFLVLFARCFSCLARFFCLFWAALFPPCLVAFFAPRWVLVAVAAVSAASWLGWLACWLVARVRVLVAVRRRPRFVVLPCPPCRWSRVVAASSVAFGSSGLLLGGRPLPRSVSVAPALVSPVSGVVLSFWVLGARAG